MYVIKALNTYRGSAQRLSVATGKAGDQRENNRPVVCK